MQKIKKRVKISFINCTRYNHIDEIWPNTEHSAPEKKEKKRHINLKQAGERDGKKKTTQCCCFFVVQLNK